MKRRNCVWTPSIPAAYYKDLCRKCQIVPSNIPAKKIRRSRKTPPDRYAVAQGDYFALDSAIAACAAASRAIGTRNGLQET